MTIRLVIFNDFSLIIPRKFTIQTNFFGTFVGVKKSHIIIKYNCKFQICKVAWYGTDHEKLLIVVDDDGTGYPNCNPTHPVLKQIIFKTVKLTVD